MLDIGSYQKMADTQRERWELEYEKLENLPSSRTMRPSRALVEFFETHTVEYGRALDIGAGKGRNSIFLAQHGYEVIGIEFAHTAIKAARKAMQEAELQDKITIIEQSAGEPLPYKNDSFDLIVDMMTLHLLNAGERDTYRREVVSIKPL